MIHYHFIIPLKLSTFHDIGHDQNAIQTADDPPPLPQPMTTVNGEETTVVRREGSRSDRDWNTKFSVMFCYSCLPWQTVAEPDWQRPHSRCDGHYCWRDSALRRWVTWPHWLVAVAHLPAQRHVFVCWEAFFRIGIIRFQPSRQRALATACSWRKLKKKGKFRWRSRSSLRGRLNAPWACLKLIF